MRDSEQISKPTNLSVGSLDSHSDKALVAGDQTQHLGLKQKLVLIRLAGDQLIGLEKNNQ